ncbi:uncharacterized protein C17orf80 homolog isoform X2 [Ochotona curzoniae]|uniref:uncharacterized protein C17orf80 homolog isoform X2 n=1 Tax=Ochotona curzoniae TaxID=130825 RepID=UPI001B351BFA|nr:uncharacterized protein C17orf80 homolog isoform X2 [Ochotona curzoniae]
MGDSQPKMEVCPYCKKPFKRLKSHLPYCKLRGLASPRDQKGQQLKPAELARGTKVKEPIRDRMKAQRGQSEREKKSTKLLRDKPVQTSETSPILAVGSEGAGSTNTPDKDSKNQVQLSAKMLNTEPETSRHGETNSRLYAPESTSAEKELSRNVCPSDNSSCSHPGTAASLVIGSLEPSLSTQGGMYPSAPPHDVHTASSDLKLDTADPQRQGLLATLLDVPPGDYHSSPRNLSDGAEGPKISVSGNARDALGRAGPSGVSAGVRDTEAGHKDTESLVSGVTVNPLGPAHGKRHEGKGLHLEGEAGGSKGNAEKSVPAREIPEPTSASLGSRGFQTADSATEKTSRDEGLRSHVFTPRERAYNEFLSVLQASNHNLTSVAIKLLQEEKAEEARHQVPDVRASVESMEHTSLDPTSGQRTACQQFLEPAQHHVRNSPFFSRVDTGARKTLSGSVGLEWFPELYPAYLGLRVLPEKPLYWGALIQKPQLPSPQGAGHSPVPWLERSSTALRSVEPPSRLPASGLSLKRLLEAAQKGWIRYNSSMRQRGVGGVTMLFTGYFILCCRWSVRHLKLQRWRK